MQGGCSEQKEQCGSRSSCKTEHRLDGDTRGAGGVDASSSSLSGCSLSWFLQAGFIQVSELKPSKVR